jgi:hypothetical protein
VDPGRVQAVGRLVEHQHLRLADQRVRDPEPLPHAQRVVAEAPVAFLAGQPDQLQHRVDPAPRQPHQDRVQPEDLPAGPAGVLAEASSSTPTCRPGLLSRAYGRPRKVAEPDDGGVSPVIIRIVVDFPAPFGPRKPVTDPGSARKETESTAMCAP